MSSVIENQILVAAKKAFDRISQLPQIQAIESEEDTKVIVTAAMCEYINGVLHATETVRQNDGIFTAYQIAAGAKGAAKRLGFVGVEKPKEGK